MLAHSSAALFFRSGHADATPRSAVWQSIKNADPKIRNFIFPP